MNSTKQQSPNKFVRFLRNHAALLLLIFCVLAIAAVVLIVTLTDNNSTLIPDQPTTVDPNDDNQTVNPNDDTPVVEPNDPTNEVKEPIKVYFQSPLDYEYVSMEYTSGEGENLFVYSSTLNMWTTHHGVDLVAADGTQVCSMFDGTVIDVTESYGMGGTVVVDHGDNVIATYSSLSDIQVVKGQEVMQGEVLGTVSTTASYEFVDGAHLHLEITENGDYVDPTQYINGEVFREIEED